MITCLRPTPGQGPGRSRVQAFWLLFSMETGPPRQAGKKARHGEQKSLPRKVRASPCRSTLLIPERTVKGDLIDSGGKTDERVGVRGPGSTGWTGNPGLGLGPGPQEVESVDPSLLPTSRFLGRAGNSKGAKTCAEDTTPGQHRRGTSRAASASCCALPAAQVPAR